MYLKEKTAYDLIQECISILKEKPEEYIYEMSHSHDKLFREVLSNVEDFKDFIAVFVDVSYLLVDINDYSIDDLIKTRTMIAYAMTLEKSKTKAMLLDTLAEIGRKLKVQDKTHLEKIIRYLFNPTLEEEAIEKLIASFESKGVDEVKNVLEVIMDQEKLKGKKEGKKEGIKEAKRQFITNMLLQGLSVSTIEKYTGISQKEIEEIQKKGGEVC